MNREAYRYILAALLAAIVVVFVAMSRSEPEPISPPQVEEPAASRSTIPEEDLEQCPLEVSVFYDVPLDIDLQAHITNECRIHGIDPTIVFAMIERESGFRADAIGDSGESYGLMQVKLKYHKDRMEKYGVTDLLDPYGNVTVGIDYLAEMLERYGDLEMALVAYNAGPSGANEHWFSKGIYSSNYSQKVVERSKNLKELTVDDVLQW